MYPFCKKARFYGEELLLPRPTPKPKDHPLSAARDCLLNIFAAILHTGGRSSSHTLITLRVVVAGSPLSRHTHIMVTLTACPLQQRRKNAPHCYVIRSLAVLLFHKTSTYNNPFLYPRTRTYIAVALDQNRRLAEALNLQGQTINRAFRVSGATFQSLCGLLCNFVDRVVSLGATVGFEL